MVEYIKLEDGRFEIQCPEEDCNCEKCEVREDCVSLDYGDRVADEW